MAQFLPASYIPSALLDATHQPDDSEVQPRLPSICVDYLSHQWQEEDVWTSWRSILRNRNDISNGVRLENASWRAWWKQLNKLQTISPETLNWLKDSDVTWLYGPLHTAVDPVPAMKISTAEDRLGLARSLPTKPILKHRTLFQKLTIPSQQSSTPFDWHSHDGVVSAAHPSHNNSASGSQSPESDHSTSVVVRPPLGQSQSDSIVYSTGAPPIATLDSHTSAMTSPITSPTMDDKEVMSPPRRHISFNAFVEQRISLNEPEFTVRDQFDEEEEDQFVEIDGFESDLSLSSHSIDAGAAAVSSYYDSRPSSQQGSRRPSCSRMSTGSTHSVASDTVTIHRIAPATLKTANVIYDASVPAVVQAEYGTGSPQYVPQPEQPPEDEDCCEAAGKAQVVSTITKTYGIGSTRSNSAVKGLYINDDFGEDSDSSETVSTITPPQLMSPTDAQNPIPNIPNIIHSEAKIINPIISLPSDVSVPDTVTQLFPNPSSSPHLLSSPRQTSQPLPDLIHAEGCSPNGKSIPKSNLSSSPIPVGPGKSILKNRSTGAKARSPQFAAHSPPSGYLPIHGIPNPNITSANSPSWSTNFAQRSISQEMGLSENSVESVLGTTGSPIDERGRPQTRNPRSAGSDLLLPGAQRLVTSNSMSPPASVRATKATRSASISEADASSNTSKTFQSQASSLPINVTKKTEASPIVPTPSPPIPIPIPIGRRQSTENSIDEMYPGSPPIVASDFFSRGKFSPPSTGPIHVPGGSAVLESAAKPNGLNGGRWYGSPLHRQLADDA